MNNSIYIALQNVMKADEPVKFFNTYRGMPVNYSGFIQKIVGNRILFKISSLQINCIILNRGTFIKVNRIGGVLRAKMADYNLEKEIVDLWGFENVINTIGFRTEVRVEPKQSLEGWLPINNFNRIPLSIFELSVRGMGFWFDADYFDPLLFTIGKRLPIFYYLPPIGKTTGDTVLTYDIEIRNVLTDQSVKYVRVGAHTFPDKVTENLLVNYLAYRQKELLAELKALCEAKLT